MKILYFDCFSGISGDMTIGALLDAGGDFEKMKTELNKLKIDEEYELKTSKVIKNGINSTKFDVVLKNKNYNKHEEDKLEHLHNHTHHHSNDNHHHTHRTYKNIAQIIESADLTKEVTRTALDIF